ncbi:alpha-galactosidase [Streptomyces galilaeus]
MPQDHSTNGVPCDAGWYADDDGWWSTVGEWRESAVRFPGGLREITARIRELGMTPGLWLEPEVVGVHSTVADRLPREAFFQRNGERVVQRGRYQLDFRHPAARAHLDETVDRLVAEHGVGYLKLDHNINAAPGTDIDADSPGDGLLGHSRAFLDWLDGVLDRHPALVLENCGSGGLRMDYAHLARMTLLSTSDQQDPLCYAPIAAAAPSAVTPEQGAVWAYPQPEYSQALNSFTMVSSLLGRVHLSGRIDLLAAEQSDSVARAPGSATPCRAGRSASPAGTTTGSPSDSTTNRACCSACGAGTATRRWSWRCPNCAAAVSASTSCTRGKLLAPLGRGPGRAHRLTAGRALRLPPHRPVGGQGRQGTVIPPGLEGKALVAHVFSGME